MRFQGNNLFIIFTFFIVQFSNAYAPAKNFTINDGLANNSVRCFLEDKNGEIWIGTDGGISIFNGTTFKSITLKDGLIGNFVWDMVADSVGGKWIASYNDGLTYIKDGKLKKYNTQQGLANLKIRTIHYHSGHLLIGTENGLFVYNYRTDKITEIIPPDKSTFDFQIMQFLELDKEILAVTRHRGVFKIDFNNLGKPNISKSGQGKTAFKIIPYSNKYFYCCVIGVFEQKEVFSENGNFINRNVIWDYTVSEKTNELYLASWNVTQAGGGLLKLENDSLIDISSELKINSENVWSVKWLKTNQLLVGTLDKGMFIIDCQANDVSSFELPEIEGEFQIDKTSYYFNEQSILDKDGKLKFSISEQNLIAWFRQKNLIEATLSDLANVEDLIFLNHRINNVKVENENIYVSSSIGLFILTKNFKLLRIIPLVIDNFHVHENTLIFQKPYKEFIVFKNILDNNRTRQILPIDKSIPSDILCFQQIGDSTIVWTAEKGLYVYRDGIHFSPLKFNYSLGQIKSIQCWKNQVILVNSKDEIYQGYIGKKGVVLHKVSLPISVKSIFKVFIAKNVWMFHFDNGIYVSNSKQYRILNHQNMLENSEITSCSLANDFVEIAYSESLEKIPLKHIFNYQIFLPKVSFKKIQKNIKSSQNSLVLELTISAIQHPNDFKYFYQINGQDTIPISENKIFLMNLSSGNYTVKILAYSTFTNKWYHVASTSFIKQKAIWEKWYFWIVLFSVISLITVVIYYRRKILLNERLIRQQKLEKELVAQKLMAIQAKMNPHFMFNALNSIQNYVIDTDTDKALHYLSEFAKLMRQTIEYSSTSRIKLSEEIEFLERYIRIEQMRFSSDIQLVIEGDNVNDDIEIPPMILQPLIENAFIHGLDTELIDAQIIRLTIQNDSNGVLRIEISNKKNNESIIQSHHKSFGIESIEQRLKLVNPKNKLTIVDSNNSFKVELKIVLND